MGFVQEPLDRSAALPATNGHQTTGTPTTVMDVVGVPLGGPAVAVIAGPCAVESQAQILATAQAVAARGAALLRGGGFKPRTSPYDFQGLGLVGVEYLAAAGRAVGLPVVSEIMDVRHLDAMVSMVDVLQVGARSMQNYELLKALGEVDRPVLIKRGFAATVDEWLLAAEYVLSGGNSRVVLCERGIRTFAQANRFTLDLASMAIAKSRTHLPVLVDPSHATGDPKLVPAMARAAVAAGADGVMVEVHLNPEEALSDGAQALTPAELSELMASLAPVAAAVGRVLHSRGQPVVDPG